MKIEYKKQAVKFLESLDRPTKQRIKLAIEGLTEQPPRGDIKPLQGYKDERKRLRVGCGLHKAHTCRKNQTRKGRTGNRNRIT